MLLSVCWADEYIALVKLQFTGMSLVIKCSDVAGHENLCRACKRPSESTFPTRQNKTLQTPSELPEALLEDRMDLTQVELRD